MKWRQSQVDVLHGVTLSIPFNGCHMPSRRGSGSSVSFTTWSPPGSCTGRLVAAVLEEPTAQGEPAALRGVSVAEGLHQGVEPPIRPEAAPCMAGAQRHTVAQHSTESMLMLMPQVITTPRLSHAPGHNMAMWLEDEKRAMESMYVHGALLCGYARCFAPCEGCSLMWGYLLEMCDETVVAPSQVKHEQQADLHKAYWHTFEEHEAEVWAGARRRWWWCM